MMIFKTPNGVIDSGTRAMLLTMPFDAIIRARKPCPYLPYRADVGDQTRPRTDQQDYLRERVDQADQFRPRTDECR
jgi:hypothetical protein